MTLQQAKSIARHLRLTLRMVRSGDYRVNFRDGNETTAHYTGNLEDAVMRTLLAAGMPVRQVNPFKLRQFARASGVLAKSDPLDARMIASFVAIMPTRPAQRTPA